MTSSTSPARRRALNIWVLLVAAVLILGAIVWQQRESGTQPTTTATAAPALSREPAEVQDSRVSTALSRLQSAWRDHDRDAFIAAAGGSSAAKSWGAQTYANLETLGVERIDLHLAGADDTERPDGTLDARVDVAWAPGPDSGLPSRRTDSVTVDLRIRQGRHGFGIEGATPTEDPIPLWLEGALEVTRQDDRVMVRVDGGSDESHLQQLLRRATADVRRVYGKPRDDLTVVVPAEGSQSTDLVGGAGEGLSRIAAVTTTLDGSDSSNGLVAVVLNPEVFTPMNARAAQVVLTHEATHALTGATTAVAPLWVVEGYADYVALSRDRLDPTRSASQILARVRSHGAPKTLPSDDKFGSGSSRLGATYESAWMVFRMLGESYDDSTITDFYRRVLRGQSTDVAARQVFGVGLEQITAQWRQYVTDWASVARPA